MAIRLLRLVAFLTAVFLAFPAHAQSELTPLVDALGQGGFPEREAAINALVATGDQRVPPILQALADGDLYTRDSDAKVVRADKAGSDYKLTDPADGVDWAKMERVPDRVLDRPALAANQAVIVAHRGREHAHVHLLVNRVHPDTDRAGSGGRTGRASSRCCARRRTS